ncbi:MAG: PA14 domain-containing protein [Melioribacteraceae bacterium]
MKIIYRHISILFLAIIFLAGCSKSDDPASPDMPDDADYKADPKISEIFPSVALANGYIYIKGENFGTKTSNVNVFFKSKATSQQIAGIIELIEQSKITVRVPANIDTSPQGNEIIVKTPKGTTTNTTTQVYGVTSSAFGNNLLAGKGLIGRVYELPANTAKLPDFATMQVKSMVLAPNLDVPTRSFSDGFPGVPGGLVEWFGIRFDGKLVVTEAGEYTFTLGSDDGSNLYIDDKLVVNADGTHGYYEVTSTKVALTAGDHKLRVDYFQGPRYNIAMRLFWTKPSGTKVIIPAESIKLPDSF